VQNLDDAKRESMALTTEASAHRIRMDQLSSELSTARAESQKHSKVRRCWCAVLCCAVLCCAVLCCAVLDTMRCVPCERGV
jgi:hypothetical protein